MKPKRPFIHRLFIFCVVAFIVYSVVGFVLAPLILKNQLEKRLPAELGRPVRIESIRVNPLILSLTLEGLAISDRDGGPFVAWDRVYVNFDPTTFFVKEWRFQEITAIAPSGTVIIDDKGEFNFADLLEKFAPKTDEPEKPAWPLRVAKLVVNGARLDFADHSRSQEFATQVGPVNFALLQFHTSPNRDAPYQFTAETESGEKLSWSGTLSVNPVASEGELQVSGIRPGKYTPYYRDLIGFDVLEGSLDVSGRYKASLSEEGNVARLSDGRVHLMGFKIAPRGTTAPVLELHDLELNGIEADATAMTMKAGKVAVTGGNASVRRDQEGTIDLLAMLMPEPSSPDVTTTTSPAQNGPKPQVEIASFSVRQFRATFEDLSTPRPARNTIENVDVDVEKLTLAEGASMPLRIAVTLPRTGSVNLSGNFVLSPLQATLAVELANVSLASISPYIEPMVNVHLTRGAVSTKGEARVAMPADQPMELEFKGDLSVDQFGAVDGVRNEELVGWSQLAVAGLDFKAMPVSVAVKEITWTDPKAHVLINRDGSINLLAALQPASGSGAADAAAPPEASAPPAEKTSLPKISIGSVKVTNGSFTFADRSVQPEVSMAINQFGGTITGLSSENLASADVDLKATVGGSGPVTITGKLNPLGENKLVDLKVDLENVELTPFSPYSGKFAGFELARGKLFLDVDAKVQNESVDMTNVVTLTQFTFGAPTESPDATKLPVRLAVALLKDTEGKITLDVPVQGSLSDPSFRIGKVVARVIGNLLTKVATSPFSLLGAMFGGGGEELAFQDFAPGSAELTPDNLKKLETLTKALKARPALNLEITGSFDAAADGQVIKLERLAQRVRSRIWDERRAVDADVPPPDQMLVTPEDELATIQKMFVEAFPADAPELNALPPPPPPPVVEEKEPERKGFFRKAADIVTLKSWRDGRSDDEEEKKTAAAPPPVAESTEIAGPAWPPLDEMKARLADLIEVTTDDHRRIAARRAERVREHFVQQEIAGERLFLANVNDEGKGARVFLQLQ